MTTKEQEQKDENGYILLPKIFSSKGFDFYFIEKLHDGWEIYERKSVGAFSTFELIRPYKGEERKIGDAVIPKKYYYPGNEQFGSKGFSCISLERARIKFGEIQKNKFDKQERKDNPINIESIEQTGQPKRRGRAPVLKPCISCGEPIYTSLYQKQKGQCNKCFSPNNLK